MSVPTGGGVADDRGVFVPPSFHPARPGLVAPVRMDPAGLLGPSRREVRTTAWRSAGHGWYLPAAVPRTPDQRIVEASVRTPVGGAVTGWAALAWMGGRQFDGMAHDGRTELPVTLATAGLTVRPRVGVAVSEEGLRSGEVIEVDGLRVTVPLRSVTFEMRFAPSAQQAIAMLDMAAYSDLVSVAEVSAYVRSLTAITGVPRLREVVPLADENSWSWRESRMRWVWTRLAGLPRPVCNVPVFDRFGRHLGTPDLFDPEVGLVGEYDGRAHLRLARRSRDLTREHAFRHAGLEHVTMLAADWGDLDPFVARLHSAYVRASRVPAADRAWTIEPPRWWRETRTVAQRRALCADDRERLLAHRLSA